MMGVAIAFEPVSHWIREARPLFEAHWREVGNDRHRVPLHVDYARYAQMERDGGLAAWTARDDEGVLVGYNVFFVHRHPHYASTVYAQNDVIYLDPDRRLGSAGVRLIKTALDGLKLMGVQKVLFHVKLGHDFGPVLERLGLRPVETIHEGVL